MSEEISPLEDHGWWMEQLRKDAKANRPEALRLADALEAWTLGKPTHHREAAVELRRLHTLNGKLLEALKHAAWCVQENYCPDEMGHDWDEVIAKAEGKV
jgi:hypothetical protein